MFSSGRNRHRFVIVVVSFVKKRVSRGVVSLTTGSLSSLSIYLPISYCARLRNKEPTTSGDTTTENEGTFKTDFKTFPPCKYNLKQNVMSLKADFFEGARFDYNKQLNQKFFLSHGFSMTNAEISGNGHIIKIRPAKCEFKASVVNLNACWWGVFTDGRVSGRVRRRDGKFEFSFTDEQRERVFAVDVGRRRERIRLASRLMRGVGSFMG